MRPRRYNLIAIIFFLILSSAVCAVAAITLHSAEMFQATDVSSRNMAAMNLGETTPNGPRGSSEFAFPQKYSGINAQPVEEAKYERGQRSRSAGQAAKETSLLLPRASKEIFDYDISWLGIYAGSATLKAVDDGGLYKITSKVRSSSFVSVFYKVEDDAQCLLRNGRPVNFRIKQHEGKYRSNKETIFATDSGNITYFDHRRHIEHRHTIKDQIAWDVMSGFYYLRTLPLDVGKNVYIDIFDSNKFYKAEVSVLRREKINIPKMGEVNTILVRPVLKSEGLFRKKGDILVWLTDDERRIPVRIETKVPVGSVVAELQNYTIK